jgi:hypothetical protein
LDSIFEPRSELLVFCERVTGSRTTQEQKNN